jgi:hypothetical protein
VPVLLRREMRAARKDGQGQPHLPLSAERPKPMHRPQTELLTFEWLEGVHEADQYFSVEQNIKIEHLWCVFVPSS